MVVTHSVSKVLTSTVAQRARAMAKSNVSSDKRFGMKGNHNSCEKKEIELLLSSAILSTELGEMHLHEGVEA